MKKSGPSSSGPFAPDRGTAVAASRAPVYPATKNPPNAPSRVSAVPGRSPSGAGLDPSSVMILSVQEFSTRRRRRDEPERRQPPGTDRTLGELVRNTRSM